MSGAQDQCNHEGLLPAALLPLTATAADGSSITTLPLPPHTPGS